jgi:high affinity Mn2+ porin
MKNLSIHPLRLILFLIIPVFLQAQTRPDSVKNVPWWNFHFQMTVLAQYHPYFKAKYSGKNSLDTNAESTLSVTSTLFLGTRLWKGASAFFNPELSGGSGLSHTLGVAGFPNGETYRVSDPAPHVYIARLYLTQVFSLSKGKHFEEDDLNELPGDVPDFYLSVSAGKFSMMDFFDHNSYCNDPRTQFYNWTLMGNGAWDYPANVRGYTYGVVLQLVKPTWAVRYGFVMVATLPNGSEMDFDIFRSNAQALEFEKKFRIRSLPGAVRVMGYFNQSKMGNYRQAIDRGVADDTTPDLSYSRALGRTKFGFGLNMEQAVHKNIGLFLRGGWNDGQNETFAFTEIDRHLSAGISINGGLWKRADDQFGLALIANGLSADHRDFLKAGGYGFIIGDGNLNYSPEFIIELYYNFRFFRKYLWLSPDYQFILHPAYNMDRGPVHAFGIRAHVEF